MRFIWLLLFVCGMTAGYAAEKVYIQADQVSVNENGIFYMDVRGGSVPLNALSHDAFGLYVTSDSVKSTVQCPYCGTQYADDGGPVYCMRWTCANYGKRIK